MASTSKAPGISVERASAALYSPIASFQTRIIQLFESDGSPDDPIRCTLHTATILNHTFGGRLAIPKIPEQGPQPDSFMSQQAIQYNALSYTWGEAPESTHIEINGGSFPVRQNLHEALVELRRAESSSSQFIWIDAICINQLDNEEKAFQVQNMYLIYKGATQVIAWLGADHPGLGDALSLLSSLETEAEYRGQTGSSRAAPDLPTPVRAGHDNFGNICLGLSYLYTRPWFERLWVQQEIFAASDLRMQCGGHRFRWSSALSDPTKLLGELSTSKPGWLSSLSSSFLRKKQVENPEQVQQQEMITELVKQATRQLKWFTLLSDRFTENPNAFDPNVPGSRSVYNSLRTPKQLDFVDLLLQAHQLQAGDPRDYIYGIIGMTGFPAKAMPIADWLIARQSGELFIPIDYNADVRSQLCAVSWVLLMVGGLTMLAKFKVLGPRKASSCDNLPSWVMDWKLAGTSFVHVRDPWTWQLPVKLGNAWDTRDFGTRYKRRLVVPEPIPKSHIQMLNANRHDVLACDKLRIPGVVLPQYYVDVENRYVCERKRYLAKSLFRWRLWSTTARPQTIIRTRLWSISARPQNSDIVVWFPAFEAAGGMMGHPDTGSWENSSACCGGLWLLRPEPIGEFSIVASLPWLKQTGWRWSLYEEWAYSRTDSDEPDESERGPPPTHGYRRLATSGPYKHWAESFRQSPMLHLHREGSDLDWQVFTIV